MAETVHQLLEYHRQDTNRRLDKVDSSLDNIYNVLNRFLIVDDKVTHLEADLNAIKLSVAELTKRDSVTNYRRSWTDRVVQGVTISAGVAIVALVIKLIVGV